jgi:hypothetical protein
MQSARHHLADAGRYLLLFLFSDEIGFRAEGLFPTRGEAMTSTSDGAVRNSPYHTGGNSDNESSNVLSKALFITKLLSEYTLSVVGSAPKRVYEDTFWSIEDTGGYRTEERSNASERAIIEGRAAPRVITPAAINAKALFFILTLPLGPGRMAH